MVDISVIFEIIIIRGFVFSRVSHGNMKVLIKGMVIVMEKILIVDDSLLQATRLKDILDDEYDITIAQTAEDGLRRASAEKYSLILLDVVMPGMDGFTLLKKLQEEIITQSIPVILITSLSDVQNEYQGLILGAVDYIVKPLTR